MSTPQQELIQPCAWTGEDYAGKSYLLQTTEGPEIVSEPAFRLSAIVAKDLRDDVDGQDARIDLLVRRVTKLEKLLADRDLDKDTAVEPDPEDDKQPGAKAPAKK